MFFEILFRTSARHTSDENTAVILHLFVRKSSLWKCLCNSWNGSSLYHAKNYQNSLNHTSQIGMSIEKKWNIADKKNKTESMSVFDMEMLSICRPLVDLKKILRLRPLMSIHSIKIANLVNFVKIQRVNWVFVEKYLNNCDFL